MSELIQPVLLMSTSIGNVAVELQIDLTREEAETEAAYYIHTAPLDIDIYTATVLMLHADMVESAMESLIAGLAVHSVDCDCDLHDEWAGHETPGICKGECDQHGV